MSDLETLLASPALLVGLAILVVIEFGLMIWALLDWIKRPAESIRGNRILWLLLIVLVNIAGPIIYLTVGRLPESADTVVSTASPETSQAALDALYGGVPESDESRG